MDRAYVDSTCTMICSEKDGCNFKSMNLPQDSAIDTLIIRCAPNDARDRTCEGRLSLGNTKIAVYLLCYRRGCKDIRGKDWSKFANVYCEPVRGDDNCKEVPRKYLEVRELQGIKAVVFKDKVTLLVEDINNDKAKGPVVNCEGAWKPSTECMAAVPEVFEDCERSAAESLGYTQDAWDAKGDRWTLNLPVGSPPVP